MDSKMSLQDMVTVGTLRGMIHPLFINLTWVEWMRLSTGDPTRSTTRVLVQILTDIMELFTSNIENHLPKDRRNTEAIEAMVGNKVPEAFAKVAKVYGDVETEHTDKLNQLIVKYVVDRVSSSPDSEDPTRTVLLSAMVEETKFIIKELYIRLHAAEHPTSVKKTSFFSQIKDFPGKIRGFFNRLSHKRSANAPMPEKLQTSSSTKQMLTLDGEVEGKKKSAGHSGIVREPTCQPAVEECAVVTKKTSPTAAFVYPETMPAEDHQDEDLGQEAWFDETSLVELFVPPDDQFDDGEPEYCLHKGLQRTFVVDFTLPGQISEWEVDEFNPDEWFEESPPEEGLFIISHPGAQEIRLYPELHGFSTNLSPIEEVSEYSSDSSGISLSDGR